MISLYYEAYEGHFTCTDVYHWFNIMVIPQVKLTIFERYVSKGYVQLERAVGKNEKLESPKLDSFAEVGKSLAKLESFGEVGKNRVELERTKRIWKEPSEVEKLLLKLESFAEVGKLRLKLESCDLSWKVHHKFQIRVRKTSKLGLG